MLPETMRRLRSKVLITVFGIGLPLFLAFTSTNYPFMPESSHAQLEEPYNPNFFFDGFSEDCVNSCWYDMVMGKTSSKRFYRFLENLPSIEGVRVDRTATWVDEPYEGWFIGQSYRFEDAPENAAINGAIIRIAGYTQDDILQGIKLGVSDLAILDISPYGVIDRFGAPAHIYLYAIGGDYFGEVRLWLAYEEQNLHFQYYYSIPEITDSLFEVCFDPEEWITSLIHLSISIINPQAEDIESLTLNRNGDMEDYVPIEDATNLAIDEIADLIRTEEQPCIEVNEVAIRN